MLHIISECAPDGYNVSHCFRMCSGRVQCLILFQNVLQVDTMFHIVSECVLGGYSVSHCFRMCSR